MDSRDTLLDLDVGPKDGLYRLRRDHRTEKRVIYVHVTDISILPEETRTSSDELLGALSKLEGWHERWETFTVSKLEHEVICLKNIFDPHALPSETIMTGYPLFDILDLKVVSSKKPRVTLVECGLDLCYLKIARFAFEIPWLSRELEAYSILAQKNSNLGPKFLGYVFEGSNQRVVGFLLRNLHGRPSCPADMEDCKRALGELHETGLIHGDPVRDNIFMTSEGPKFIDFELCFSQLSCELGHWNAMKEQEYSNLVANFNDPSNKGRPWD